MRAALNRLTDRFNKLTPRERSWVFVAGIAVIAGIGFLLFIDGALTRQKALRENLLRQQGELVRVQGQNIELTGMLAQDPDAVHRHRIAELHEQLKGYDTELRGVQEGLVAPQRMVRMLEGMLAGDSRVRLVRLNTLPVSSLVEPAVAVEGTSPAPSDERRLVYKHGIELTVEGSYPDLVAYQARLEKLPWRMFWARSQLDASDYPRVRLTLTLYTLSLDKAWLVV